VCACVYARIDLSSGVYPACVCECVRVCVCVRERECVCACWAKEGI